MKQVHIAEIESTESNVSTWTLPNDVSSWLRLVQVTAFVFRFIQLCRFPNVALTKNFLHVEELKSAELFWIKHVQMNFSLRKFLL